MGDDSKVNEPQGPQEPPCYVTTYNTKDKNSLKSIRPIDNDFISTYSEDMPKYYFSTHKHLLEEIETLKTPALESIGPNINTFQHYNIRYFENYYSVNFYEGHFFDVLVRVHTNKVLLLALADGHYIMQNPNKIRTISFIVNNTDRSVIKPKGKKKLGARILDKHTIIGRVQLEGSEKWHLIRAGIPGYLVEINESIKNQPNLLKTHPEGIGYLAVAMPKGPIHDAERFIENLGLLKQDEYFKYLSERPTKQTPPPEAN